MENWNQDQDNPNSTENTGKITPGSNSPKIWEHDIHNNFKANYIGNLASNYIHVVLNPSYFTDNQYNVHNAETMTNESTFNIVKEKLKDSTLVDLGCGGPESTDSAYEFATAFGVKKYIGVEKYLTGETFNVKQNNKEDDYENGIAKTKEGKTILELKEKNPELQLPEHEFLLNKDMVDFLVHTKEQSNFLLSGLGTHILLTSTASSEVSEKQFAYMTELESQLDKHVPPGGIVIANNSPIDLRKFGFERKLLFYRNINTIHTNKDYVVWQKPEE